jgi:hypothetical protein
MCNLTIGQRAAITAELVNTKWGGERGNQCQERNSALGETKPQRLTC